MSKKEISELESQIKQMQETIEKLKKENDDKEKELNKYKLPRKEYEKYCYITNKEFVDGVGILSTNDDGCSFDNINYHQYNYFTDENKAQKYVDHIKLQLELFQIRDMINGDWKPVWDYNSKTKYVVTNAENEISNTTNYYSYAPFAFETPEKRDKFIELVGEDKIMKYLSF